SSATTPGRAAGRRGSARRGGCGRARAAVRRAPMRVPRTPPHPRGLSSTADERAAGSQALDDRRHGCGLPLRLRDLLRVDRDRLASAAADPALVRARDRRDRDGRPRAPSARRRRRDRRTLLLLRPRRRRSDAQAALVAGNPRAAREGLLQWVSWTSTG